MNQEQLKKIYITATAMFILALPFTRAQNMSSPYSVYGIGDIDHKFYNRTSGTAGAGLASKSSMYIIDNNPASVAGLERSFMVAGVSTTGKSSIYKGDPIDADNSRNKDFWIKNISIGIKLNNFWASSIGFNQFSSVNYRLTGTKTIEGSTSIYNTLYEGSGGLNDYYWTNAVSIGKHISIGVKSSVIGGAIDQAEVLYEPNLQTTLISKQQDYFSNLRFQYGAIYATALSKNWDFSIGGRYIHKTKLVTERALTVTQNSEIIVDNKILDYDRFWLPSSYAAGVAFTHKRKTTFLADYSYGDWASLKIRGSGWNLVNSHKLAAGVEFSKPIQVYDRSVEKRFFQLGGFFNNSYLQVRGKRINEFGFTAGMGGWLGNNLLYGLSGEFGVRGTTHHALIRENYFQITLSLSYRDFLFSKGRKYD